MSNDNPPGTVIPFRKSGEGPAVPPGSRDVIDAIDKFRASIMAGEPVTGIAMVVVDARGEIEKTYVVHCGLRRMELIGHFFAAATAIAEE